MGIIKQGILGGFSKKVGSVVGTSWKGIAVMKSMPLSVVNPKTTAQVNQRNAFKLTALVASAMLTPTIQDCWNRWAKRMSGYNAFIKTNVDIMKAQASNLGAFLMNMIVSNGELTLPSLSGTTSAGENSITFNATWDDNAVGGKFDKSSDIVVIGALYIPDKDGEADLDGMRCIYAEGVARTAGATSITVNLQAEDDSAFPFMFVKSADGYFRSENLNFYSKIHG